MPCLKFDSQFIDILTVEQLRLISLAPDKLEIQFGNFKYPFKVSLKAPNTLQLLFEKMRAPPKSEIVVGPGVKKSFNYQNTSWTFSLEDEDANL